MDFMASRLGSISSSFHPNYRLIKPFELFSEFPDEFSKEGLATVELTHLFRQRGNKGVKA